MQVPAGFTVIPHPQQVQQVVSTDPTQSLLASRTAYNGNCLPQQMQAWTHPVCVDQRARSASPPPQIVTTACMAASLNALPQPVNRANQLLPTAVRFSHQTAAVAPARVSLAVGQPAPTFVVQTSPQPSLVQTITPQVVVRQASMPRADEQEERQPKAAALRSRSAECEASAKSPSPENLRPRRASLHNSLYEDAFARKMRLQNLTQHYDHARECEEKQKHLQRNEGMKPRRRTNRTKDTRTHLEREEEHLRRVQELRQRKEKDELEREQRELEQCTFKPQLGKNLAQNSPRAMESAPSSSPKLTAKDLAPAGHDKAAAKVKELAEKQKAAVESLRLLNVEQAQLQKRLRATHTELSESIRANESQRIAEQLRDSLLQKTAAAADREKMSLVEELEDKTRESIQQRISEVFSPIQLEQEGELYVRHLAIVHQLEILEAEALALGGVSFAKNSNWLGFEIGVAERARRGLTTAPGAANLHSTGEMFPKVQTPRTLPSSSVFIKSTADMATQERSSAMGASLALLDALGKMTHESSDNVTTA